MNKNTVPGETGTAVNPSGIRLGSPAATTFGFGPDEFREIGRLVAAVARDVADDAVIERTAARVTELCASVEARRSARTGAEGAPRVAARDLTPSGAPRRGHRHRAGLRIEVLNDRDRTGRRTAVRHRAGVAPHP